MAKYTDTPTYRRCQALFDRVYPGFRDAGSIYHGLVAARIASETRVLELGCGHGSLAAAALCRSRLTAGIDLDVQALQKNEVVDYPLMANAERLPFPADHFDLVTSQWALEHFPAPSRAFIEVARVLKPTGQVVLFTTNANNYVPILSRLVPTRLQTRVLSTLLRRPSADSFRTYYRANTARSLARAASAAGLEVAHLTYVGNPFYLAFSLPTFALALLYEKVTDLPPWNSLKLYMIAVLSLRGDHRE